VEVSGAIDELQRTLIERQLERLVLHSIRAFDARDWQAFADTFTADGVFVRANAPGEPLVGRKAIIAGLAARAATRLTRHLCTNIEIEVSSADTASGRCYLLLFAADATEPAGVDGHLSDPPQRIGEYHDTFSRTAEGWRIARRAGRLLMYTGG
jgi:ketosteroid isomerase-like protein